MQEVIGSTPIFSTEVNEGKPAGTTQVVSAGFVLCLAVDAVSKTVSAIEVGAFPSAVLAAGIRLFLGDILNILLSSQLAALIAFGRSIKNMIPNCA